MRMPVSRMLSLMAAMLMAASTAQPGPGGDPHGPGSWLGMIEVALEHLDLSEAQQEQVRDIFAEADLREESDHERMKEIHGQLARLIHAEYFDEEAVRRVARDYAEAQAGKIVAHAGLMRRVRAVLTADQLNRLETFHELHHGMMRKHGGHPSHGNDRHH